MNSFVVVATFALFAGACASSVSLVGPHTPGVVLQGPGAKAAVVGPDGSHISAGVHGGTVVAPPQQAGVVSAAIAPGYVAHGYGHGAYAAPAILAAPAVHAAPVAYGLGVYGGYKGYHPLAAGSGLEGQWVPDHSEKLYDDGSYKGEAIRGHALVYGHGYGHY